MAAGDQTTGRRVSDDTEPHLYEPGDYGNFDLGWYCRVPGEDLPRPLQGYLTSHQVVEHDDGTITVSPSILVSSRWAGKDVSWHGYLERGVWREV